MDEGRIYKRGEYIREMGGEVKWSPQAHPKWFFERVLAPAKIKMLSPLTE